MNDSNDSQDFAERLIRFGAVHYCPIHPPPVNVGRDDPAGQQQLERAQAARAAGTARHGKDVSIYFLHGPAAEDLLLCLCRCCFPTLGPQWKM